MFCAHFHCIYLFAFFLIQIIIEKAGHHQARIACLEKIASEMRARAEAERVNVEALIEEVSEESSTFFNFAKNIRPPSHSRMN